MTIKETRASARGKFHQDQGIEAEGDQQKGKKDTGKGEFHLPDEKVHDGQQRGASGR